MTEPIETGAGWIPQPGGFFRPRGGSAKVHILASVRDEGLLAGSVYVAVCGQEYREVRGATDAEPRQCADCWGAM